MEIELTNGLKAIVDDDLYSEISNYKWYARSDGRNCYAARNMRVNEYSGGNRRVIFLHHVIIGKLPKGLFVDHINGDQLDNRKINLRFVTARQNSQNRKCHREGSLVGTVYCKDKNRWRASITVNRKAICLGYFNTEKEANRRYLDELEKMSDAEIIERLPVSVS